MRNISTLLCGTVGLPAGKEEYYCRWASRKRREIRKNTVRLALNYAILVVEVPDDITGLLEVTENQIRSRLTSNPYVTNHAWLPHNRLRPYFDFIITPCCFLKKRQMQILRTD